MAKYIFLYRMDYSTSRLTSGEFEIFEGTKQDAIATAIRDGDHMDYGRSGVEIYRITDDPIFAEFVE